MTIITLTTDFGQADHYVACMKGVILQRAPDAAIVDVTHDLPPQSILHGAFVLRQIVDCFPAGTIHVAIVDPGVGTRRRILAARYGDHIVLAPDNGLVTFLHRDFQWRELRSVENSSLFRQPVSATFHGRDIFAPVAGFLAAGGSFTEVGPLLPAGSEIERLPIPVPRILPDGGIQGEVMLVDRFGNLITNIGAPDLNHFAAPPGRQVFLASRPVGEIQSTYAQAQPGAVVALIGSAGLLEIAINRGNAAATLHAGPGTEVIVR